VSDIAICNSYATAQVDGNENQSYLCTWPTTSVISTRLSKEAHLRCDFNHKSVILTYDGFPL
jgi:hypothetical protein